MLDHRGRLLLIALDFAGFPPEAGGTATFYPTEMEHSATSAGGSTWERTPWRALHHAAWDTLSKTEDGIR